MVTAWGGSRTCPAYRQKHLNLQKRGTYMHGGCPTHGRRQNPPVDRKVLHHIG